MKQCYVCAEPLNPNAGSCLTCNTPTTVMAEMERAASRNRFLFGRVRARDQAEPKQLDKTDRPSSARPRPKPSKRSATPSGREPAAVSTPRSGGVPAEPGPPETAVLPDRPPADPSQDLSLSQRGLAIVIDVVLCLLINAVVLKMVLLINRRGFDQLLTFSLIPLLFVMLCFTGLYFWLFIGLFDHSLGHLWVRKWRAKP